MSLEEKVNAEIKAAMLSKQAARLEALRAVKNALLLLKTSSEAGAQGSELKAIQKMVKQRKEAAEIYQAQNRPDLADVELFQSSVIEEFLPKSLSMEELSSGLNEIIRTNGFTAADFGKAMGIASKAYAGQADGKVISDLLRSILK
jgi:uncharacterized protein YqeY